MTTTSPHLGGLRNQLFSFNIVARSARSGIALGLRTGGGTNDQSTEIVGSQACERYAELGAAAWNATMARGQRQSVTQEGRATIA